MPGAAKLLVSIPSAVSSLDAGDVPTGDRTGTDSPWNEGRRPCTPPSPAQLIESERVGHEARDPSQLDDPGAAHRRGPAEPAMSGME